ncbi:aryl hydrocarbon receptor-like [Poecilia formosa]|nr:PREDICTED: aryl hydrocarbon receptor-like [Poecilia formosa]
MRGPAAGWSGRRGCAPVCSLTRRRDALRSGANCANALRSCCSETGLRCIAFLSSSSVDGFGFAIPIVGHDVCGRKILAERWPGGFCVSFWKKGADMYAGRKRRKPVQRAVKQPSAEGAKSNPSKRHRDRLNGELEQLASLLPFPEEVTASLDKLSILRLSVSYLRAKNFFSVALSSQKGAAGATGNNEKPGGGEKRVCEGELLLQALNGFVLVTTADGTIFYSSHTIQDYLGFHQTDVMHQSVYELVHTEDQQELRRNLHWALNPPQAAASAVSQDSPQEMEPDSSSSLVTYNPKQLPPENSSFLERNFVCRFRCLLDNSSGFLALNIQGRLKFLHGQNQQQENGGEGTAQLALFAIATPLQPPSILEIRTKNMIFRTKHKLDFTPLACDAKGKIVLGYTEAELRVRGSGYQFIHAADMLYCAENHVRMIKTGESGLTVFRLLTKENRWKWVQANARLVYKNGKPDYIIATQRPLLDEEGGEHLHKRSMHLPFTFATGEALLYQSNHPIAGFIDGSQEKNSSRSRKSRAERLARDGLDPGSLLGALMSQDQSVYVCQPALEPKTAFQSSFFGEQTDFSVSELPRQSQSWDVPHNGILEPGISEPSASFDPLLATLDSLTLEGQGVVDAEDGSCSNSELFGALEGLGLSAEDLELLLLDERMIRVEMDSDRVPTLDDLLTNDEILSYIYNCIEGRAASMEHRRQALPRTTATVPTTVSASESNPRSGADVQMHFPHCKPGLVGQAPIVQLSQQMQQHLNMRKGRLGHDWSQHRDQLTNGELLGHNPALHNGHWTAQDTLIHAGLHLQHTNSQHVVFSNKATELDGEFLQQQMRQQFQHYQQSITQKQLSEHRHVQQRSTALNGMCDAFFNWSTTKPQWQDFGFAESLGNDPCPDSSQKPNTSLDLCTNYGMAEMPNADFTVSGRALYGKVGQQDRSEFTVSSFQQQEEVTTVPFAQCPLPKTSLEQIVGVGKPCSQLDHSDMMSSEIGHDPSNSKMKGCILDTSYPGGCVLPNENGAAPPAVKAASSETIPQVPDSQASGFYL